MWGGPKGPARTEQTGEVVKCYAESGHQKTKGKAEGEAGREGEEGVGDLELVENSWVPKPSAIVMGR